MRIDIRRKSARPDFNAETLRDQIERRLGFALGRFGDRISHVCLFLEDLNGPRGGIDLECRAVAKVRVVGDVVVESRDSHMNTLIDSVAERLGKAVARRLERQQFRQHKVAFKAAPISNVSEDGSDSLR